jgi:Uma2 family endonuclease
MSTTAILEPQTGSRDAPRDEPVQFVEEGLYEVVNGERVEKPMSALATWIANELGFRLQSHARARKLGHVLVEMLFVLDPVENLRRRPDISFIAAKRWPLDRLPPETGDWEIVPDLAVEVVSPNDLAEMVGLKVREYHRAGVNLMWVVLPQTRQIQIHPASGGGRILDLGDTLEAVELLPGFRLPLAELFVAPLAIGNGAAAPGNAPPPATAVTT